MPGKTCAAIAAVFLLACTEISGNRNDVLSVQFDTLASPSVVVGDTLRDTLGVISLPHVIAFNFQNETVSAAVRYRSPDRGVSIDSLTGLIIGDSMRATPVRIIASVGALQAQQPLGVTFRPDTIVPIRARDTLTESLLDTTKNFSSGFSAQLIHHTASAVDSGVPFYIVSFQITSPAGSSFVDLVNEAGKISNVDTTDAQGTIGRRVHLHILPVGTQPDSVVINATAKYRGVNVKGSPVRLVVIIKQPSGG